jgi:hypothetical protein
LMSGQPAGPFFDVNSNDCYWVPNGAFNCALTLYLDSSRNHIIGSGMLNSTDLATNSTTTTPGFHFVYGSMVLTTSINQSSLSAALTATNSNLPSPSDNFQSLTTTIFFPASLLLPTTGATTSNAVANGITYVGSTEYLTLWGSNGGPNWDASSRTTGLDIRLTLTCSPPVPSGPVHSTGACPECPGGSVTVPSACIAAGAPISQTVSGTCIALSFASSTSTSAFNGCSGGSF